MAKYKMFTRFDRASVQQLRDMMTLAVADIEKDYGIKILFGNATFDSEMVTFNKVKCWFEDPSVKAENRRLQEYMFNVKRHGYKFGITLQMIGKTVKLNKTGETAEIIGCADRIKKFPIIARTKNGRLIGLTTTYLEQVK